MPGGVHAQGGVCGQGCACPGVCVPRGCMARGHACLGACVARGYAWPGAVWPGGHACLGGVHGWGVGVAGGVHAMHTPRPDTTRYSRSMSGRYASYWNTFLFFFVFRLWNLLLSEGSVHVGSQLIFIFVFNKVLIV